jgi:hypothetical protein
VCRKGESGNKKENFRKLVALYQLLLAAGGVLSHGLYLDVIKRFRFFDSAIHVKKDYIFFVLKSKTL